MMTDTVAAAYNDRVRVPGSGLGRVTARLRKHPTLERWPGAFLPRPLFLGRGEALGFASDLQRLAELLFTLPDRLFDGDMDRFCAAIKVTGDRGRLMRRLGTEAPRAGRADVYHDGSSMKLLEFGTGSELGGWGRGGEICRALMEDGEFSGFADDHGLGYIHNGRFLAGLLRSLGALIAPGRDPVVALLEGPGALSSGGHSWRVLQDVMRWFGLDFHIGEVTEVTRRGGRLCLRGVPVDVVYRAFEADQLIGDSDAMDRAELIFRAHQDGAALLWTPLESNVFCEKTCMALLSRATPVDAFSAAERELIDRVLPWTRILDERVLAEDPLLVHECQRRQHDLIVKPNGRFGGIGVVAGWEIPAGDWLPLLRKKAADGCVVQERVVPRPERVIDPDTGDEHDWHAVYGFFYTPLGHSGAYARALPASGGAVIGTGGQVHTAGVFYHADPDTAS